MDKKTNVLFILSDQHQAKMLGFRNHRDVKTPFLDQMAKEGVSFNNAITQNPICTPSRMCWISGQYCHNHGYYGLDGENPDGLPTAFGYFKTNGYHTAAIGKIHCPEYWVEDDCDFFCDVNKSMVLSKDNMSQPTFIEYLKANGVYDQYVKESTMFPRDSGKYGDEIDVIPSELHYENTKEGYCVQQTIEYIDAVKDSDKPFFIHLSFDKPHQPYRPAKEFLDMYDHDALTLPPNAVYDMSQKAPHMLEWVNKWKTEDWVYYEPQTIEAAKMRKYHGYIASITQVDHSLKLVHDYLKENGLLENTIIMYSTDHGEYACEHGIMEKAPGICSDAVTRIPMLWYWKDHFKSGTDVQEIVETVDFTRTITSLVGLEPMATTDGKDISDLLYGKEHPVHKIGLTEMPWARSVRKGDYRFVYYIPERFVQEYPDGFYELYNIKEDPWEMNNLYFAEGYEKLVAQMQAELLNHLVASERVKTALLGIKEPNDQYTYRHKNWSAADGKIGYEDMEKFKLKTYL